MLINKRCTSGNINILRCMFPRYRLITENTIPESPSCPAIYAGDYNKLDEFITKYRANHLDFIAITYKSDIDLDNRRILANIVFEKWRNATMPKYLDEIIDTISQDQFIEAIKIKWFSGKWTIHETADENNFLTLIDELNKSKYELIKSYFNYLEENKSYILESSILTFLQRVKNKNYTVNSFKYRKKLEMYKGAKLDNSLRAIDDALEYNIDNKELRMLNILMSIQDSNKIL